MLKIGFLLIFIKLSFKKKYYYKNKTHATKKAHIIGIKETYKEIK